MATQPKIEIDTDRDRLDVTAIHAFLSGSYWARGIPVDVVRRAIAGSLCFGLYEDGRQIGFARVVTDHATFAYLADVYVLDAHRGRGLGRQLVATVMAHPDVQGLRRWMLATRDAHALYAQAGFTPLAAPDRFMERHDPDIYTRHTT
jgi:GNAT superfamily N-acetyltransferase